MVYDNDEPILELYTTEVEADLVLDGYGEARFYNKHVAPLEECTFKVLLEVKGVGDGDGRSGVDLVAILDNGGSMTGAKLEITEHATQFLLQKLGHTDRLSIVTQAEQLCPLRQITENSRTQIANMVDDLVAMSSTNIFVGLNMAFQILNDRTLSKGRRSAIMLISDGIADAESDAPNVPFGEVPVFTFGVGSDCNPEVLSMIAAESDGGMFAVVPDLNSLNVAFSMSLAGLLGVVIEDLTLTITPINGSKIINVNVLSYHQQTKGDVVTPVTVAFGSLYDRETLKALVELALPKVDRRCAANILKILYEYRVGGEEMSDEISKNVTRMSKSTETENEEVLAEERRIEIASLMKEAKVLANALRSITVPDDASIFNTSRMDEFKKSAARAI
ncbi:hypothetical protein MKW94_008409 [Papaver nudicaule]|uniref:VWFA domain-containing protein n=1 Tax=Papaver nudicaule TaxID=74823 RepID=A0AA41S7J4_PAPNU|nr:hypothetical protein [Papaver nudicaule]